jgi:hypothetical protein
MVRFKWNFAKNWDYKRMNNVPYRAVNQICKPLKDQGEGKETATFTSALPAIFESTTEGT